MHAFELQSPDDDLIELIRSRLGQHLRARPTRKDAATRDPRQDEAAETERVRQAALAAFFARRR